MRTVQAILAGITGNMMGDEGPITDFIIFYLFANLNDLSGNFVTENPGSFLDPIPFHNIAAADATCQYLD